MIIDLLDLGSLYVSDFLAPGEEPRCPPAPLKLQMDDDTGDVRLSHVVDPAYMYGRYWYRSGINDSMKADLEDVVTSVKKIKKLKVTDVWLDIACNDGTLLSSVKKHFPGVHTIGIDPVDDTFKAEAEKHGEIIQDFFSKEAWDRSNASHHGAADVITCIAMFYDLDDPMPFLRDVRSILHKNGVFILQLSYTPLMLNQLAFDNIVHEHVYYYTLQTLWAKLEAAGLQIMDVQLNDTNGGSFRVYVTRDDADVTTYGSQPHRDVCEARVNSLLAYEDNFGYNSERVWDVFSRRVYQLRDQVRAAVMAVASTGGTVAAYGASTKGNSLLQYFGLDSKLIKYAVERSPAKFGLRTVGTNIPIISEEEMRANPPEAMLILPWCFQAEFIQREAAYLRNGGMFIIPCPEFKIITKDDL